MPAPIVLFVYNRPGHTRYTVEALARNRLAIESELYVYSDAPAGIDSTAGVSKVRAYLQSLPRSGWFKDVRIREAGVNRGLAESIIHGVTEVISSCGSVIVLEDDLVTAPDFLQFMNAALEYYRERKGIGSISGHSPLRSMPADYTESVYSIPRNCSHGWATWKDRWIAVDWKATSFAEFKKDKRARKRFNQCGTDRYDRLCRQMADGINSWSIRFGFWLFYNNLNTIYPVDNRVLNIGYDGSGVHGRKGDEVCTHGVSDIPLDFVLSCPQPNVEIIAAIRKHYSGTYRSRISRVLRTSKLKSVDVIMRKIFSSSRR